MDEEKETQEVQESPKREAEETPKESNQEEKASTALLDEAKSTAARIEKANEQTAKLLEKQEKLLSEQALAGRSFAGRMKEEIKQMDPIEYAKATMKGEVNPLFDKKNASVYDNKGY